MEDAKIAAMRRYAIGLLALALLVMGLVGLRNLIYLNELDTASQFVSDHRDLLVVNSFTDPEPRDFDSQMVDKTWLIDARSGERHLFEGEGINSFVYVPDRPEDYLVFATHPHPADGPGAVARELGKIVPSGMSNWVARGRILWRAYAQAHAETLLLDPGSDHGVSALPVFSQQVGQAMASGGIRLDSRDGDRRLITPLINFDVQEGLFRDFRIHPQVLEFQGGTLNSTAQVDLPGGNYRMDQLSVARGFLVLNKDTGTRGELQAFNADTGEFLTLEPVQSSLEMLNAQPLDASGDRWYGFGLSTGDGGRSYYEVLLERRPNGEGYAVSAARELELPSDVRDISVQRMVTAELNGRIVSELVMFGSGGSRQGVWLRAMTQPPGDGTLDSAEIVSAHLDEVAVAPGSFDTYNGDYLNWQRTGGPDAAGATSLYRYPFPWSAGEPEQVTTFPGERAPDRFIAYRIKN